MGCVVLIVALLAPRVALLILWVATEWLDVAFDSFLWPFFGFLLLPYTTLVYVFARVQSGRLTGAWVFALVIAIMLDIAHSGGAISRRRRGR